MKTFRVYLDTSVINFYYADDSPKERDITRNFFQELTKGNFEVYISSIVLEEIEKCSFEKQNQLKGVIRSGKAKVLENRLDIETLAGQLIKEGAVPIKQIEDATHLAFALFYEMDYLVSWNFNHIVRTKTKRIVSSVAIKEGYRAIQIISPLEGLDNED